MSYTRIHLISSPRNLSTALMYSFANREDTFVVDEPLYGHYLKVSDTEHPGKREILETMETDWRCVVDEMVHRDYPGEIVFFKGMAHHMVEMNWDVLFELTNLFLIRDPGQLISSFDQVIAEPQMKDIGVKLQYQMFELLIRKGKRPTILDSGELLKDPGTILDKVCHALGIPFEESMLTWKSGPIAQDGIWAKYWYANVHRSTGFAPQPTSRRPLPKRLVPLYKACLPYYEKMHEYSLRA